MTPSEAVAPAANLTQECDPLEPLPEPVTLADLIRHYAQTIAQYQDCRTRHQGLAKSMDQVK